MNSLGDEQEEEEEERQDVVWEEADKSLCSLCAGFRGESPCAGMPETKKDVERKHGVDRSSHEKDTLMGRELRETQRIMTLVIEWSE